MLRAHNLLVDKTQTLFHGWSWFSLVENPRNYLGNMTKEAWLSCLGNMTKLSWLNCPDHYHPRGCVWILRNSHGDPGRGKLSTAWWLKRWLSTLLTIPDRYLPFGYRQDFPLLISATCAEIYQCNFYCNLFSTIFLALISQQNCYHLSTTGCECYMERTLSDHGLLQSTF